MKKDGLLKLALDSKKLNEWVIKNKYKMPNIEERVDQVAQIVTSEKPGKTWFSSADLDYAYGQLELSEETAKLYHPFGDILSKQNQFAHEIAFEKLEQEIQTVKENAHFNTKAETRLTCDASHEGLVAVLEQFSNGDW